MTTAATAPGKAQRYIPVPPTLWQPNDQPTPAPKGTSPFPYGAHPKSTAQREDRAEPETFRLGQRSINDTPTISPSKTAWEAYRKCSPAAKQKYGALMQDFCRYMEVCENSGFQAAGIAVGSPCIKYPAYQLEQGTGKNDFGKRHISGPLLNRWHPDRRTGWIAKMHHVSTWYEANRIEGCTLISLTGYQERSGLSWYDTLDAIQESRIKLLKILRKYFGKLSYFWVVEPHESGYPHIHLAIFKYVDNYVRDNSDHAGWVKCPTRKNEAIWELMDGEGMEDKLRRMYSEEWKTGSHTYGLDFQQMRGENSIQDLKNYLMKYISKGYITAEGWSQGELIFNAHLYGATHENRPPKEGEVPNRLGKYLKKYRIIGMSRDLSELLKPEIEDKEDIVWLHTDETEPELTRTDPWTGEEIVIADPKVKVLYDRQLIPDWHSPDPLSHNWGRAYKVEDWKPPAPPDTSPPQRELTLRQRLKIARDGYL